MFNLNNFLEGDINISKRRLNIRYNPSSKMTYTQNATRIEHIRSNFEKIDLKHEHSEQDPANAKIH